MPVVKTWTTYFGGHETKVRVYCNTKGMFTIKLPPAAKETLGVEKIVEETMDKAIREFESVRQQVADSLKTERKVIRYQFLLQEKHGRYHQGDQRDDIGFGIGKGIQFAVTNLVEVTSRKSTGEESHKTYRYEWSDEREVESPYPEAYRYGCFDDLSDTDHSVQTIEWTEERERWFLSLCAAMDSLIANIKALDENPQLLLQAVQSGNFISFDGEKS